MGDRRRCAPGLLVLLVLLGWAHGGAAQTDPDGATGSWRTALVIDNALARPDKPFEAFDTASLVLADIDGDGQLEIVTFNDNNRVYVLDVRTGAALAEIITTHPGSWSSRDINPITVSALDPSNVPCLVIPNGAAFLSAWCYDAGASSPTHFAFERRWEARVDAALYEPDFREKHPWMFLPSGERDPRYDLGLDGGAVVADVNGDGWREVFVQTDGYPGQFSFDANGSYRWSHSWYDGNGGPVVLDVHRDGRLDACFASDAGDVACFDAANGDVLWTFRATEHGAWPGSVPLPPLVTDVDGDGHADLFFGARNARYNLTQADPPSKTDPTYDAGWIDRAHAVWFLLDARGTLKWQASYDWMNPLQYNHPAAVDVNGDGVLDLVALDWNTIGHKPGDWETTSRPPNLFALDGRDGSVVWRADVGAYWSNMDFVIADADGDGVQEILVPEPREGVAAIAVHALRDGARQGSFPVPWGLTRGPVAGDLFGDGTLSLVVPVARAITDRPNYRSLDVGYREGALQIIRTGQPFDALFTANFLGNAATSAGWAAPARGETANVTNATTPEPSESVPPTIVTPRDDAGPPPATDVPTREAPGPTFLVATIALLSAAAGVRGRSRRR